MSINRQQRRDGRSSNGAEPSDEETEGLITDQEFARQAVSRDSEHDAVEDGVDVTESEAEFVPAPSPIQHRFAPRQFLHEVNVELRKVSWPSRKETINYSLVVLITLIVVIALIFGLDWVFTKLAGFLFNP